MKLSHLDDATLNEHYAHVKDKPFFADLKTYMMETPVVALILEGIGAIEEVRKILGSTNPRDADAGTIRADLSMNMPSNMVHASDSETASKEEIARFFGKEEIFTYKKLTDKYHFGEGV